MNILITGGQGMLGKDLVSLMTDYHDITAVDRQTLDITCIESVRRFTCSLKPDFIINCAAYTNVDGCETNVDAAFKTNAVGPRNLAIMSNILDVPLLHISTDYVFDGRKEEPYIESDITNPLSVYGKSKLDGENYIKALTNKFFIVRTQWLYGHNGGNFVKTIIKAAKEHGSLKVVDDQIGNPTYTKDLCAAIQELVNTDIYGTYHVTNSGTVSWYDFTKEILTQTGLENVTLVPCRTEDFPRLATRPSQAPLSNFYWSLNGCHPMRDYKEALADYLSE